MDLDADGWPVLPQSAQVTLPSGVVTVPVWDGVPGESFVGSHPSREYRHSSIAIRLVTVVKLATGTLAGRAVCLAVAWVPAAGRGGDNPTFDLLIAGPTIAPHVAGLWPVVIGADGSMTVPSLDADGSAAGLCAQGLWPAGWRVRLPTDENGDPMNGVPAAPPSGPRCIGEVVA